MTASDRVSSILEVWNKIDCVRFAVWCAKRVEHLGIDYITRPSIASAERWLLSRESLAVTLENTSEQNRHKPSASATAFARNHNQQCAHYAAYYAAMSAVGAPLKWAGFATLACSASAAASGDTTAYELLQIYLSEQLLSAVNS